ncbi:hypothetical protein KHA90_09025 [Flavobacterium psychroterrae]|uniref:Uncharacterized protein n=1 Tax=Flavobacterium psychroterrae TaxID=2133767 RepID=A0ABS5PA26_9FLAO|nr:hypothetical protein [Flavobacterium psychroterrae]MBS7231167.1 hypothetical protein [Flavobacterium psychroterrae]
MVDKSKLTCEDIMFEIVKSSDLDLKDYKNYFVRIERIENDSITLQVNIENNLSDNPKEKQMVESTIAWLLFLPNEAKLWNTSADPENPVKVNYNFNNLENIYKACNISKKEIASKSKIDSTENKDCKEIVVEMGSGQECIIRNSTLEKVYADIIKNKEVTDSKYFLNSIPTSNKVVEINKDGLIDIEYTIKKDKIEIVMSYDGGVTEVNIEKSNNNVVKKIVYNAD